MASLEDKIRRAEQDSAQLLLVARLQERLLAELMKSTPPPAQLAKIPGFLRSAQDLLKHGEPEATEQVLAQAEEAVGPVRQWLGAGDLNISPFFLRNSLEKHPPDRDLQAALIHYFLTKQPHVENDRDKLDYLLTAVFGAGTPAEVEARLAHPEEIRDFVEQVFAGMERKELDPSAEVMLHELESLIARVGDFNEFDQLVKARMVERVRILKTSLGESFYHPRLLPAVIRFNVTFRHRFDKLFREQLTGARQVARQHLQEAWSLVQAIEAAYEALALPATERQFGDLAAAEAAEGGEPQAERLPTALDERPPIDQLLGGGEEQRKETELRGLISRIARFLEKPPPDQAQADPLTFALRHTELKVSRWEHEAFLSSATAAAPESTLLIQRALGVVAWLGEEWAQYNQTRSDRYIWKTHFDHLCYAVGRAIDLLKAIQAVVHQGASEAETAWFQPLLHTALRLGTMLNRVAPVFEEPAAA